MAIHVAQVALLQRDEVTGEIFNKESSQINKFLTQKQPVKTRARTFTTEHRIIESADIPNSTNNPTIKEYLVAEDASGFSLVHIDQTFIITKN
jgi:hypothetical protein